MLKKVFKSTLLFAALAAGSLQTYAENRAIADHVVAVVGSSVILLSDVENSSLELIENYRSQGVSPEKDTRHEALEMLLMQKLLYNQAIIDSVAVNLDGIAAGVERMLDQEIAMRGSIKAVEEFYNKPVFEIREDIKERYTEAQYAQSMQYTVEGQVVITPGEVERYYRSQKKDELPTIPEQYVFAQIMKYPPSTEDAKFRARQSLIEMRERIMNGTRFDVLARMYSVDGSAVRGGEMDPTSKAGFVKPFGDALAKLSEGQVSGVVETEYGFHLIELLEKMPADMYRCRHILVRPIFTNEEIAEASNLLDSLRKEILKEGSTLTFAEAATEHSDDKYSQKNGGVVTNFELLEMYNAGAKMATTRFLKEELGRDDFNYLTRLKEGEISVPFTSQDMRGNQMVKILQLIEVVPAHTADLDNDYIRVEELALQAKQDKVFKEFVEKKAEGMYIRIDDRFKNADFDNKFWVK